MIYRLRFRGVDFGWEMLNEAGYLVQDYEKDMDGNDVPVGDPHLPRNNKGPGWDIIVLGYLYEPSGETELDAEGNVVPIMNRLWGWHVDIVANTIPEILEEFVIHPNNPRHVV